MKSVFLFFLVGYFGSNIDYWFEQSRQTQRRENNYQQSSAPQSAPQEPKKQEAKKDQAGNEVNTLLMKSTFMLLGQTKEPGKFSTGTGFILGRPIKDTPTRLLYVLITAAHILEGFDGQKANILLRKKNSDGKFEKVLFEFPIADAQNKPLWNRHPDKEIDVAVMYISLPSEVQFDIIPISWLGGDVEFEKFEIHPGDELQALGFPLSIQSPIGGFPILRSGKIASYPLTPAKEVRKFYFDFQIYPGNSGGPVYFIQTARTYNNTQHLGETIRFIVGLVSAQTLSALHGSQPVYLAEIVPAQFILEAINSLPEPKD